MAAIGCDFCGADLVVGAVVHCPQCGASCCSPKCVAGHADALAQRGWRACLVAASTVPPPPSTRTPEAT